MYEQKTKNKLLAVGIIMLEKKNQIKFKYLGQFALSCIFRKHVFHPM